MGACCTCLQRRGDRQVGDNTDGRKYTVAVLGLDNAGKTAVVKALKGEPPDETVPSIGFKNEEIDLMGHKVTVYDLGGGTRIRAIWRNYYADVHGVVYVIDSSETDRFDEAMQELKTIITDERMRGKPCLILANKQDRAGAVKMEVLRERMNFDEMFELRENLFSLAVCSAVSKDDSSVKDAFQWLAEYVNTNFVSLDERVQRDVTEQRERQEKERKERIERIRLIREQRDAEEAAQRALSGETGKTEEEEFENGGNPFKRVDASQFANTESKQPQNIAMRKVSNPDPTSTVTRVDSAAALSADSAIVTSRPGTADGVASTSRSVDNVNTSWRTLTTTRDSEIDNHGFERSTESLNKKSASRTPNGQLPPLEMDKAKRRKRTRAKKNQTAPVPSNGHASRSVSAASDVVRPHDDDLFVADSAKEQRQRARQLELRVDGRGDEMSSAMVVSSASIRNRDVETLGELETDSDDAPETGSSHRWPSSSLGDNVNHRPFTSPPAPLMSSRVAEYLVDAMTLQPNGDASDVDT